MAERINFYVDCPHCGSSGGDLILLQKKEAEAVLGKEIPYNQILLCPKGCRYTTVERWNA